MAEKPNDEKFEVTELDDEALNDAAGGSAEVSNLDCPTNPGCNYVAGCGCSQQ